MRKIAKRNKNKKMQEIFAFIFFTILFLIIAGFVGNSDYETIQLENGIINY